MNDEFIQGYDECLAMFRLLPKAIQGPIMERAIDKSTDVILTRAVSKCRKRFGSLSRSLRKKVKQYDKSGVTAGIVGPDSKYTETVTVDNHKVTQRPAKYAHLVERGHRIAIGGKLKRTDGKKVHRAKGKSGGTVPGHPFLRPALYETQTQVQGIIASEINTGIEEYARKAGAK